MVIVNHQLLPPGQDVLTRFVLLLLKSSFPCIPFPRRYGSLIYRFGKYFLSLFSDALTIQLLCKRTPSSSPSLHATHPLSSPNFSSAFNGDVRGGERGMLDQLSLFSEGSLLHAVPFVAQTPAPCFILATNGSPASFVTLTRTSKCHSTLHVNRC